MNESGALEAGDILTSLQGADVALETAYARVRQVRHELRALSQERHTGFVFNDPISSSHLLMNPGHEAVVLAEEPDAASRPSGAFNSTIATSYRPQWDSYLTRHNSHDDPATSAGRPIAARTTQRSPYSEGTWPVADIFRRGRDLGPELSTEDLQTQQLLEYRTNENRLHYAGRHDSLPRRRVSGSEMDLNRGDFYDRFESAPSNFSSPQSTPQPRGSVSSYSSRSSSLISSVLSISRRLSLLTDVSLRNFPSPSSTTLQPVVTDEALVPLSSDSPGPATTAHRTTESRRRYVIRRRLNSFGEEVIRHIHLDFEDQGLSALLPGSGEQTPAQELSFIRDDNTHNPFHSALLPVSNLSPPSGPETRRRAWARLNADGDEIPMDEEEGPARLRTDHRLQAQSRVGQRDVPIYPDMPLSESPINGAVPLPYDHPVHEPFNGRAVYGSVEDPNVVVRAGTETRGRQRLWNEPGPFRPSALPIPLSEMIPSLDDSYTKEHSIPISEFANLACR